MDQLRNDKKQLLLRIELLEQDKIVSQQKERTQQEKILTLHKSLSEFGKDKESRNFLEKLEIIRTEKNAKELEIAKYIKELNQKEKELENLIAENRQLR